MTVTKKNIISLLLTFSCCRSPPMAVRRARRCVWFAFKDSLPGVLCTCLPTPRISTLPAPTTRNLQRIDDCASKGWFSQFWDIVSLLRPLVLLLSFYICLQRCFHWAAKKLESDGKRPRNTFNSLYVMGLEWVDGDYLLRVAQVVCMM